MDSHVETEDNQKVDTHLPSPDEWALQRNIENADEEYYLSSPL